MNEGKIVFLFSGQGSQHYHMARGIYESDLIFYAWLDRLDKAYEDLKGKRLLPHLFDKNKRKHDLFVNTVYTHPLIFMVQYALVASLIERGIRPHYLLGSSLGEYVSFAVGEVLGWSDILTLIVKQADMLDVYGIRGKMLAIFANSNIFFQDSFLNEKSELVTINTDAHFVVSGSVDNIGAIENRLNMQDIIYVELPVEFAFHSSLMDVAKEQFLKELQKKTFNSSRYAYISALSGSKIRSFEQNYLWQVARHPINLQKAIQDFPK